VLPLADAVTGHSFLWREKDERQIDRVGRERDREKGEEGKT
jgi:hypothetical protein